MALKGTISRVKTSMQDAEEGGGIKESARCPDDTFVRRGGLLGAPGSQEVRDSKLRGRHDN